ncbi:MAG: HAD family phosphatase [Anaerolineae bacterium]|nr:MAG: HAD family phosphatase [Anaerolineae bacterium]
MHEAMIEAVFWDLGGVIVRTEDRTKRERWEQRLGMEPRQLDRLIFGGEMGRKASRGEIHAHEVWEWVRQELDLSQEEGQQLTRDFWQGDDLDPELVGYIRGLRAQFQTGLISNAWLELREQLVRHWRIDDAFDDLVISAEVGLRKPDPAIYRLALDRLEVRADRAIFVDDLENNISAAAEIGMHAVLFRSRNQAIAEVDRLIGN